LKKYIFLTTFYYIFFNIYTFFIKFFNYIKTTVPKNPTTLLKKITTLLKIIIQIQKFQVVKKFTLRNCHSNDMIDFTGNFITLLICNDIPDTDDIDNAFSKRLRCINFPTEFVMEPKKENQKKLM
jgi:hypothetical protein